MVLQSTLLQGRAPEQTPHIPADCMIRGSQSPKVQAWPTHVSAGLPIWQD